ncbi:hypothetical protein V1525DRAFT_397966 [Lipomyces kononenkoae]|uniref:Uncharacterized protein n=1 Tax=Lipomyces kononenkoae TaxID=34357 RepID=A0ACC3T7L5_LIPKO
MLRAFAPVPVVELSSRERIQAIFASRDKLYVGLASGTLKVYSVPPSTGLSEGQSSPAKLLTTIDNFTKRAIEQLAILEEARVLVAQSDSYVYLYDLDTYTLQERLHRTKGAFVFATSSDFEFYTPFVTPSNDGLTAKPSAADIQRTVSRLVVSAKKKLHCYEWQGAELIGSREISIPERPRSLTFIRPDKILCGMVVDYFLVDISASTVSSVFAAGRPVGPLNGAIAGVAANIGDITSTASASARRQGCALATLLPEDDSVLLVNEFSSAFLSAETGAFVKTTNPIKWKDVPAMLGYTYPYIVSITANGKRLEVRSPKTYTLLQSINFPFLSHFHDGKYPFVASSRQIWQLSIKSFEEQVQILVEKDQLDEAISLVEGLDDVFLSQRADMLRELKMMKAEELFKRWKFQRSMIMFSEVSAPPERVLTLYPAVIAGDVVWRNNYDDVEQHVSENGHHDADEPQSEPSSPAKNNKRETTNGNIDDVLVDKANEDSASGIDHDESNADKASVASTNKDFQRQKDVEFFDRFLRPSILSSKAGGNGAMVAKSTSSPGAAAAAAETMSLAESLANFLSIGRNSKIAPPSEVGSDLGVPESLEGKALNKAVRCLLIYLIDTRRKIARLASVESGTITREDLELVSSEKMTSTTFGADLGKEAIIVDTALLRCYMLINPQLVGPLVRLPNYCDKDVVRQQLESHAKWSDLVDFYYTKKLHRDALELLKQLGESEEMTEFFGPEPIVQYLQKLGNEHINLIFEFATGPIRTDEKYGIDIFMANTPEAESLSRTLVVKYLAPVSRVLTIKYLEHLVFVLGDLSPEFHNELALAYLEDIKTNAQLYALEDEMLQRPLDKLLKLLRDSKQYKPEKILGIIPRDSSLFLEVKAVLFSRIGEHKRALEIYVFSMKDYSKAQEYCMKIYDTDTPNSKSVFHTLLELYLRPPGVRLANGFSVSNRMTVSRRSSNSSSMYNLAASSPPLKEAGFQHLQKSTSSSSLNSLMTMPPPGGVPQVTYELPPMNLDAALELLSNHGSRVSAIDALELLPEDIKMASLGPFLEAHLRATNESVSRDRLLASLLKTELVRTQQTLIDVRSKNVVISDTRVCPVCVKRLGNSVISVFPNRAVVHYGCAKQYRETTI